MFTFKFVFLLEEYSENAIYFFFGILFDNQMIISLTW